MTGYYLILSAAAVYAGLYTVHAFRKRAYAAAAGSLLLVLLPVLCAVARRVQQGRADWSERLVCAKKRARAALRCAVVL